MHVMFIHPNFPAQFGRVAADLTLRLGWQCTVVTSIDTTQMRLPYTHLNYHVAPGPLPKTYWNPDNLQGHLDHLAAVYRGLRSAPQIKPDLVVGHTFYGTMLYLKNLYSCPFVGYFEMLPPPFWSDALVLRKEFPPTEDSRLFNATYHTLTHLHMQVVDAAYTPTHFQLQSALPEWRPKTRVIFDGVDAELFQPRLLGRPIEFRGRTIGPRTRVVTYVSRGLESIRGFDIFMRVAKRIYTELDDVLFLVAGQERTNYGFEVSHLGKQTFKEYVLSQDSYDLSKFVFLGLIPMGELATLYNLGDLHVYLTVPYVLSWSLVQAMAAGCTILGSATPPVQEAIDHGVHGLLADFDDVEGLARHALAVLREPEKHRHLGAAARQRVLERYELQRCTTQLANFFEEAVQGRRPS